MSVYTTLNEQDFQQLLSQYNLGQLVKFEGIAAGVENTNYRVTVKQDGQENAYFLTIFEYLDFGELDFYLPLLEHLEQNGCRLANPIKRLNGELVLSIKDKPAAVFTCLKGGHAEPITEKHCTAIGEELARIHLAGASFAQPRDNSRGFYWLQHQVQSRLESMSDSDKALIQSELQTLKDQRKKWETLPSGVVHGDLFPDNALFDQTELSGVIDFYVAASEVWVYDLAITLMAWSRTPKFTLNSQLYKALLKGYQSLRPLQDDELTALPFCLRMAAMRFWMSRLVTQQQQKGVELTTEINPEEMRNLLTYFKNNAGKI